MHEKPVWYRALVGSVVGLLGANSLVLANRLDSAEPTRLNNLEVAPASQPFLIQSVGAVAEQHCVMVIFNSKIGCTDPSTATTSLPKPSSTSTTVKPSSTTVKPEQTEINSGLAAATPAEISYLGCISLRESNNDSHEYNGAGPYYGKYQFLKNTWSQFVTSIGYPELAKVDIRDVPEPVQDYIAWRFLRADREEEWGPNKYCAHYLG